MRYLNDIKLGMLQVRENESSLRRWSAHLGGNIGRLHFVCSNLYLKYAKMPSPLTLLSVTVCSF